VRLPLAVSAAELAERDERTDAPPPAVVPAPTDVLCIEDNPANLRLIEGIFATQANIRLLSALAPGLGLELARTHKPALILLDINLPDMDGYAVMEILRAHEATRQIPVLAISANAMPKDLERGKAAGFAAYLTKPIDVLELLRIVTQLLAAQAPRGQGTRA
jgi:CheY-like chemotaxis protein